MKKIFALTLCLLMLAGTALAGTAPLAVRHLTDKLDLVFAIPEGVKDVQIDDIYDMKVLTIVMEDASMPTYTLAVSYSEVLHEKDITDLTEEELNAVIGLTALDSDAFFYEMVEMDDGWPAVLIQYEEGSESDWVDAFTVIAGYFIQVHGVHDDFSPLTEEENVYAFTLLDCIDIVDMTE